MPARDEEGTVGNVVARLLDAGLGWVRVVDNGSRDQTVHAARSAGADVYSEPQRGYGRACWRGLQRLPAGCQWVLFCDADGSDDLSQLPDFFAAAAKSDFVLGNRRCGSRHEAKLGWLQHCGNGLATALIRLGWGHRYFDLGPLRLIRRDVLEAMEMKDRTWGWTLEMQVKALEGRLRVTELPVNYLPRQGGESKISGNLMGGLRAGWVILWTLGGLYLTRGRRLAGS